MARNPNEWDHQHMYDRPPGPHGESTGGRCIACDHLDEGLTARAAAAAPNWLGLSGMDRLRLIEAAPIEDHDAVEIAEVRVAELEWLCEFARVALRAAAPPGGVK